MKYDLVIFDMDGTILNTLEDLADSLNATLRHFHYPEHTIGGGMLLCGERNPSVDRERCSEGA